MSMEQHPAFAALAAMVAADEANGYGVTEEDETYCDDCAQLEENCECVEELTVGELWNNLVDGNYFTEAELQLVAALNGYTTETLNDAIYARHGAHDWEGLQDA